MIGERLLLTKVSVAMLGARRHYAVPRLLHEAGLLDRFFTDSYIGNKPWLEAGLRVLPASTRPVAVSRWLGRKSDALPGEKVVSFEWLGLWYAWSLSRSRSDTEAQSIYAEGARRFSEACLKHRICTSDIIWGFNGAASGLFEAAKRANKLCVLEQTSNPREIEGALTTEEYALSQDWLVGGPRTSSETDRCETEVRERELAHCILAGSQFVADGLVSLGVDRAKVVVAPFGVDLSRFSWVQRPAFSRSRKLRVLFVGRVSVMKGVPYLLRALKELGPKLVEARFVGKIGINPDRLRDFSDVATFVGAVPRSEVLRQYRWADVFCFPSITEGSAAVTYEALATGLPVVTTPNAGSIVRDGVDGFTVPVRSLEKIVEALHGYANNPELLTAHQEQLRAGRARAGLARYKTDLVKVVHGLACS